MKRIAILFLLISSCSTAQILVTIGDSSIGMYEETDFKKWNERSQLDLMKKMGAICNNGFEIKENYIIEQKEIYRSGELEVSFELPLKYFFFKCTK